MVKIPNQFPFAADKEAGKLPGDPPGVLLLGDMGGGEGAHCMAGIGGAQGQWQGGTQ